MAVDWEKVWSRTGDVAAVVADVADGPDGEVVYINQAGQDDDDKTTMYLTIGAAGLVAVVVLALLFKR